MLFATAATYAALTAENLILRGAINIGLVFTFGAVFGLDRFDGEIGHYHDVFVLNDNICHLVIRNDIDFKGVLFFSGGGFFLFDLFLFQI